MRARRHRPEEGVVEEVGAGVDRITVGDRGALRHRQRQLPQLHPGLDAVLPAPPPEREDGWTKVLLKPHA
jgi:NADPH:quinone reductase-like Zn-dependent oxidoreductase